MLTPDYTLIQFSDTHIVPEGELLYGKVDTLANVVSSLDAVTKSGVAPAAIILSGDLADTGDQRAYERLRDVVEPAAAAAGTAVLYAMGNHDQRGPFRAGLLGAEPETGPYDYTHWSGDLRIIVLDSTVPGEPHGELDEAQLEYLAGELASPAAAGTILVLHHPPVPSPLSVLNSILLREPERLAKVIKDTDVMMILCGHSHHPSAGVLAGVPVWVAGATAYSADTLSPADVFRGQVGGSYTRVDVFGGVTVATAVPVESSDTVHEITTEQLAMYIEAHAAARAQEA